MPDNTVPFWKAEVPQTAQGRFIKVEYFPAAGKLSIEKNVLYDGVSRSRRMVLDRRDFLNTEIARLMETVVHDWTTQNKSKGDDLNVR